MNKITLLTEEVINKIAAGEVIERPACVLRELLDNALDAQANKIRTVIHFNPFSISVEDDGEGIVAEQVELAFKRHTTSKIKEIYQLENFTLRGFRGEALAAIASVSQVTIVTKPPQALTGIKLVLKGGEVIAREEVASNTGTKINIENLFYNTPVRRKFISWQKQDNQIKIKNQERKNIKEEILHHVLASSAVSFYCSLIYDKKKEEINIPLDYNFLNKINFFFGNKPTSFPTKLGKNNSTLKDSLIAVDYQLKGFKVKGYISNLSIREKNSQKQFLIINNRIVKDYRFIKALQSAYQNKIPWGTYPIVFIKLFPPQEAVDINVHPQKKEVRFQNNQDFFEVIYYGIKKILNEEIVKKQRAELSLSSTQLYQPNQFNNQSAMRLKDKGSVKNLNIKNGEVLGFNKTEELKKIKNRHPQHVHLKLNPEDRKKLQESENNYLSLKLNLQQEVIILGQVALCYIIFAVGNDLFITDQHAAHERINFDLINKALKEKNWSAQKLLIPIILEKSYLEKETILSHQENLKKFQIEVEDFGENNLRINSYPSFIKEEKIINVLNEIFQALIKKENIQAKDLSGEITARMACRMSVMKGDKMSSKEMKSLIQEIYEKDYIHTCPHGRPFVKKISEKELDSLFDRNKHIRG